MLLHLLTLIWFKVDFVCVFYSDVDLELPIRWAFQKKFFFDVNTFCNLNLTQSVWDTCVFRENSYWISKLIYSFEY